MVFDFGGGTLDVSIVSISSGTIEVKASSGNTHLGGEELDKKLVDYFVEEFKRKYKKDLTVSKRAMYRLHAACERTKRILSSCKGVAIEVDSLFKGIDFRSFITRARFENLVMDILAAILIPVESTLSDSGFDKAQIDDILLVGGSTRIPKVQQLLQDFFDGKNLTKSIHPDEAVAYGAAIRAAVLNGDNDDQIKDFILRDIIPLSLGIEVDRDQSMSVIIPRNTPIPTTRTQTYTTMFDNQIDVWIRVYEGESELVERNHFLDSFRLYPIPAAPLDILDIDVTFSVDSNGIFHASAVERALGREKSIIVSSGGYLNEEEVNSLISEGVKHKTEEKAQKEVIEFRNQVEASCLKISCKIKQSLGDTIPDEETRMMLDVCNDIEAWLQYNRYVTMKDLRIKFEELKRVCTLVMMRKRGQDGKTLKQKHIIR